MKTLRPLLLAVAAFLFACGAGTTPDVSAVSEAGLKNDVVSGWVDFDIPITPSDGTFPPPGVPCFGHSFTFLGVVHVHQQTITAGDGTVKYVLRADYDPPVFTSETGAPWTLLEHGQAHPGVEVCQLDGTCFVRLAEMDKIPLLNEATGERLTVWAKFHIATNAAGEIKAIRENPIYCTEP